MAHFDRGSSAGRQPFGRPQILRSAKFGSYLEKPYMISGMSMPTELIDGDAEKILYPGEVIAKITTGTYSGLFGVRQLEATDGRQLEANIVGICADFVPVQLNDRDVEVAVLYQAALVQSMCSERNAAGARVALPNATADMLRGKKNLQLTFPD